MMSTYEVVSTVGVVVIGLGLVATWLRNSRSQAGYIGKLEAKVEGIMGRLDDEHTGLGAIKAGVDKQVTHCARVSSGFAERIKDLEGK